MNAWITMEDVIILVQTLLAHMNVAVGKVTFCQMINTHVQVCITYITCLAI